MNQEYENLLMQAYKAFNAREIASVTALMSEDVNWPNGWEGGFVKGRDEVKDYWTRQWKEVNPTVVPVAFKEREDRKIEVKVHQIVKDLQGKELFNGNISHIYTFSDGLIQTMEIEPNPLNP